MYLRKTKTISLLALLIACTAVASFIAVKYQMNAKGNDANFPSPSSETTPASVQTTFEELTVYALSLINSDR
jgi:hypothetical protein